MRQLLSELIEQMTTPPPHFKAPCEEKISLKDRSSLKIVLPHPSTTDLEAVYKNQLEIEKKRIENLNARMKQLEEIIAVIAHEIRNPLGGIKGFATLLQRDLQEHPQLQQITSHIINGIDGLERLVSNVLNDCRPFQLRLELTDLVQLTQNLEHHLKADRNLHTNIKIAIESSLESLQAPIDPQLFKSALLNLSINGIQSMPKGGLLKISLKKENDQAIFEISDTGVGIPKQHLETIFLPFFTTKDTGNGLGLSRVQHIILAHEGTINASSVEGQGSCFTLSIPLKTYGGLSEKRGLMGDPEVEGAMSYRHEETYVY